MQAIEETRRRIDEIIFQMNIICLSAAVEASRLIDKQTARECAVIAEEMRSIVVRTSAAASQNINGSISNDALKTHIIRTAKQAYLVSLNAALLVSKKRHDISSNCKPFAVLAEEFHALSAQLGYIFESRTENYRDISVSSKRNTVVVDELVLFRAASGLYTWFENACFVAEVLSYDSDYVQGDRLVIKNSWRDMDIPLIKFDVQSKSPAIAIISNTIDRNKFYAVFVDSAYVVSSYPGISKNCSAEIPARECWEASNGEDMIFPDWEKMVL